MVILFVWLIFKASVRFTALSTRGVELERHLLSVNLDISSQAIVNRGGSWRGAPLRNNFNIVSCFFFFFNILLVSESSRPSGASKGVRAPCTLPLDLLL